MKKGISVKKHNKKRYVLYRFLVDSHGGKYLSWNLGRFPKPGDRLVFIHVCSGSACEENLATEDRSAYDKRSSLMKKIITKGSKSRRRLVTKILRTAAEHGPAMAVIAGIKGGDILKSLISFARYCEELLPEVTAILVVKAFRINCRLDFSFNKKDNHSGKDKLYGISDSEEEFNVHMQMLLPKSISLIREELPISTLGWPLLQRTTPSIHGILTMPKEREMSVVEWATSLPSRRISDIKQNRDETSISGDQESDYSDSLLSTKLSNPGWPLLRIAAAQAVFSEESEDSGFLQSHKFSLVKTSDNSFLREGDIYNDKCNENCLITLNAKRFSYSELKRATCQFSLDNLIGEGGCSVVYKGCLPCGKSVAVKILKYYKESWKDFSSEVEIISSLKHKNITPLVGVCTEDNHRVLVYDFLTNGSLDKMLHGGGKKYMLPWEVRFKMAISIAEALNYLHKECVQPVIHRDVKSSNILLSAELEPQLSDFGLAILGPSNTCYMIVDDLVGTFGYIAPEYFMHGRVSDKVEIYSFGVVLLELLSGRRPISVENEKGQGSIVAWAKSIFEIGNMEELLDPDLDYDEFATDHVQRMALVAKMCINQSPQNRPTASQTLELLRGEKDAEEWVNSYFLDVKRSSNQEDTELSSDKRDMDFSYLYRKAEDPSVDSISVSRSEQKHHFKLRDYLKHHEK